MSKHLKTYFTALTVFLIIDGIWLGVLASSFYRQHIGYLLADEFNFIAAGLFYLLFVLGLVVFVINPAIEKKSFHYALKKGALFGLITYATYDLTNQATIRDWPVIVTVVDLIWGAVLATSVSVSTVLLHRIN